MLMYQLVAVERGKRIKNGTLRKSANRDRSELISRKQGECKTIIEPVAGPQYRPFLLEQKKCDNGLWRLMAEQLFHSCTAVRGFVDVKTNGDVWPCPFVEVSGGNVRLNGEIFPARSRFPDIL